MRNGDIRQHVRRLGRTRMYRRFTLGNMIGHVNRRLLALVRSVGHDDLMADAVLL